MALAARARNRRQKSTNEWCAMKLEDFRKDYYAYSTKASELSRQLSFAGIALIWIFKIEKAESLALPSALLTPALLFSLSLALDLAHAAIGTAIWGAFSRLHERRGVRNDADIEAPPYLNWPALLFFWTKLACVAAGYVLVLIHIGNLIKAA